MKKKMKNKCSNSYFWTMDAIYEEKKHKRISTEENRVEPIVIKSKFLIDEKYFIAHGIGNDDNIP